jgi:hypothetical protein
MTSTTTAFDSRTTSAAAPGAATGLVAAALTTAFADTWSEIAICLPVIVVATVLVFGLVVPRALRKASAGTTALALSIPALLLALPAFWSGLPLVLGVAGLVVGNAGRTARSGARKCIAAVALAALAVLAYVSIYVAGAVMGQVGFLID